MLLAYSTLSPVDLAGRPSGQGEKRCAGRAMVIGMRLAYLSIKFGSPTYPTAYLVFLVCCPPYEVEVLSALNRASIGR